MASCDNAASSCCRQSKPLLKTEGSTVGGINRAVVGPGRAEGVIDETQCGMSPWPGRAERETKKKRKCQPALSRAEAASRAGFEQSENRLGVTGERRSYEAAEALRN